jgi:hypothetical protein
MTSFSEYDRETIESIATDVRNKMANPDDVRQLLKFFCSDAYWIAESEAQKGAQKALVNYLQDSFKDFLSTSPRKSLESSLGLEK